MKPKSEPINLPPLPEQPDITSFYGSEGDTIELQKILKENADNDASGEERDSPTDGKG